MLIQQGLRAADEAHANTFIEATPMGLPLYKRHGWEEVDELAIDMRKYGGGEVAKEMLLVRPARGEGGGEGGGSLHNQLILLFPGGFRQGRVIIY